MDIEGTSRKLTIGVLIPEDHSVTMFADLVLQSISRLECVGCLFFAGVKIEPPGSIHRSVRRLPFLAVNLLERAVATRLLRAPIMDGRVSLEYLRTQYSFVSLRATRKKRLFDYFDPASIATLKERCPDILIRFTGGILKGDILSVARYGVWSYHHADNRVNRGGPAGFWEWFDGRPITGTIVQKLNEDLDNGVVLARQQQKTIRFSWNTNRLRLLELSVPMMADAIRQLAEERLDMERLQASSSAFALNPYSDRLYVTPSTKDVGKAVCKLGSRLVNMAARKLLTTDQWHLLLAPNTQRALSLRNYKRLLCPEAIFWADPFILGKNENGELLVAVEEYDYTSGKRHISVLTVAEGAIKSSVPIIKDGYDYSYPFILRHEGELYLIPECASSGRIDAFKCVEYPYRWERCRTLMAGVRGIDPTIIRHNGLWWMFLNEVRNGCDASAILELSLFHAQDPLSDRWVAHRMNPVVSDVTQARSAGRPFFLEGGRLVRPAQDCSVRYGYGVKFMEIEELSETSYRQVEVACLEPRWAPGVRGVHHVDHDKENVIIDYFVSRGTSPWKPKWHST